MSTWPSQPLKPATWHDRKSASCSLAPSNVLNSHLVLASQRCATSGAADVLSSAYATYGMTDDGSALEFAPRVGPSRRRAVTATGLGSLPKARPASTSPSDA